MLFCGLLVIDHAVGLIPDDLPDQDDWARIDAWVVCVDSVNTAKLMEAYAPGRATNLLVEPDRGKRYQKGLRAAEHVADYALLLQPGTSINNLELPVLNRETDAVVLQYVGRNNLSRWRRMLVRCDNNWRYDEARAQWELVDGTPVDVMAIKASLRENPASNYTVLQ